MSVCRHLVASAGKLPKAFPSRTRHFYGGQLPSRMASSVPKIRSVSFMEPERQGSSSRPQSYSSSMMDPGPAVGLWEERESSTGMSQSEGKSDSVSNEGPDARQDSSSMSSRSGSEQHLAGSFEEGVAAMCGTRAVCCMFCTLC
jgi:hypothetical protein